MKLTGSGGAEKKEPSILTMAENPPSAPDYSFLAAFDRGIDRPRVSFLYLCGLLLATVTMVLLPLIYLAIAGGVGFLVYYHAVHDGWLLISSQNSNYSNTYAVRFNSSNTDVVKLLLYFAPLFAGVVALFFLFKPIFARKPKAAQTFELTPAREPVLYEFIQRICETVGAPAPKRIDLDCRMNASAGLRRGFLSLFGHDLVLTLGLPLVANLTVEELAGVVAHEFGHFTQGMAMRLSYIIRRVNLWFARVVYQRDAWDVRLENLSTERHYLMFALYAWVAHLGVALSRQILLFLMKGGNLMCGFIMRQMEYDADAYGIKVAGSGVVEMTQRKLATLGEAQKRAYQDLRDCWKKHRALPDNLPELVRREHASLSAPTVRQINERLVLHRAKPSDSHPSPGDRIHRARLAGDHGIFHDSRPADVLFTNFEQVSAFVTLRHYTDNLRVPQPVKLMSVRNG